MEERRKVTLKHQRGALRAHATRYVQQASDILREGTGVDTEKVRSLHDRVVDLCGKLETLEALSEAGSAQTSMHTVQQGGRVCAKLPKLSIAKFDGQPLRWREFWDSFESAIHTNDLLSAVDKFNYLRSLIQGEAERSIRGIAVTNANYEVAISTIKERFGNEQTVIFAHFDELFRLPASHCETSKLRLTYDDCERHIRGLEALGVTEDKFGIVFVPLILFKLPEEIRVDLNRKNGCQRWELKNLRQLLKEEIVARELGENRTTKVADWRPKFKIAANHGTAKALVSNSRTTSGPRCVFCDQSHYSDECRKHPDLQSRKLKLRDRCFACLRKGHLVTSCPRPSTCFYCKRKHHRSLCPSKFGNGTTDQAMSVGPADFSVQSLKRKSEATSATSMLLSPGQRVLMQTASTIAENPEVRYQSHPIRILLDTGSQRSFITSDLMRKLCLKSQGFDTIVVATFSAEHSKTMKVPRVKLSVKLIDGSYKEIIANVVPTISCPINKVAASTKKP